MYRGEKKKLIGANLKIKRGIEVSPGHVPPPLGIAVLSGLALFSPEMTKENYTTAVVHLFCVSYTRPLRKL